MPRNLPFSNCPKRAPSWSPWTRSSAQVRNNATRSTPTPQTLSEDGMNDHPCKQRRFLCIGCQEFGSNIALNTVFVKSDSLSLIQSEPMPFPTLLRQRIPNADMESPRCLKGLAHKDAVAPSSFRTTLLWNVWRNL